MKVNESKNWFFEKENRIEKPLARLAKKKGTKSWMKELITNSMEIKKTTSKYFKQLYDNKLDSLDEMDRLMERHKLPNWLKKK